MTPHITLAFSHDPGDWISRVMAWATFGAWTHIALVNGDRVLESSGVGHPKGVREVSLFDFAHRHPIMTVRRIAHPNPDAVWRHAHSQIGCRYDWPWLWGRLFRRCDWQRADRWVCSELIAWAAARAGRPLFAGNHLWWVSPQMLFMISKGD